MSRTAVARTGSAVSLLQINGLEKIFEADNGRVEALRGIDLDIAKGEFVCLLGASGCGKSTLLRIIAGFEQASGGSVEVHGAPVSGPGPDRGIVFQDYALFPWLTVRGNIGFGPKHAGLASQEVKRVTEQFMEMVGLTAFANHYPHQLSGGMKQRVAIARVLANDTDLLLMDEPFGALDALTRTKLQEELLEIWQRTKLTVVFVTHSVEEAVVLADRVLVMSAGPGRIDCDYRIDLSRPRDVSSAEFNSVRRDVTRRLRSNLAPARILAGAAEA
jgi:NitT/TauT family transport system ATP-binding protein/sulfonate transport system ATP-binding protein